MSPWNCRWWNHGASTLGQATGLDKFVLYLNSLVINGYTFHQLKNKIFGQYQPDSPWFIMVFLWFSHGFPMVFPWFSHGLLGPLAAMALSFAADLVPTEVTTRCFTRTCRGVSLRPWRPRNGPCSTRRPRGPWGSGVAGTAFFRMGWPGWKPGWKP